MQHYIGQKEQLCRLPGVSETYPARPDTHLLFHLTGEGGVHSTSARALFLIFSVKPQSRLWSSFSLRPASVSWCFLCGPMWHEVTFLSGTCAYNKLCPSNLVLIFSCGSISFTYFYMYIYLLKYLHIY